MSDLSPFVEIFDILKAGMLPAENCKKEMRFPPNLGLDTKIPANISTAPGFCKFSV